MIGCNAVIDTCDSNHWRDRGGYSRSRDAGRTAVLRFYDALPFVAKPSGSSIGRMGRRTGVLGFRDAPPLPRKTPPEVIGCMHWHGRGGEPKTRDAGRLVFGERRIGAVSRVSDYNYDFTMPGGRFGKGIAHRDGESGFRMPQGGEPRTRRTGVLGFRDATPHPPQNHRAIQQPTPPRSDPTNTQATQRAAAKNPRLRAIKTKPQSRESVTERRMNPWRKTRNPKRST
jgi:hypothetical protein